MSGIYTHDGIEKKSELWLKYRYLIRREALRLQAKLPAGVELDDLIQAGAMGLLTTIDQYDAKKGASLSTFIMQRVRWAMIDELRERDWVPRRVRTNGREIAATIQRIEQGSGKVATEADVAEAMGVSLNEYQSMLMDTNVSQIYSLEELREEFGEGVESIGPEQETLNPLHAVVRQGLLQKISHEIETLPEREQLLLNLYYQQELNMKEIAVLLDITETRVSQLHSQAIKLLQARLMRTNSF
ncbi:RNA polymerase sigma factor FliA [Pantoea sp.]|uniref:RNA polymerase sigma factor FliA n=1 Tax=Pantoea sp. TaxID=69393 RepID=UPI0028999D63|nr:RNA polymerase sigma factor FliA [Pantoea sp.]